MITLQFGQYGNQIMPEILKRCHNFNLHSETNFSTLFRESPKAQTLVPRSLLIDMEPKVIHSACLNNQKLPFTYLPQQAIFNQSGSGNNWAHGFAFHGPKIATIFTEKLRKELEHADTSVTFFSASSLAGGTGSGLGSFLLNQIAQEHPKNDIFSHAILPFRVGEVNTQNFNALLSLSTIQEVSHSVLLLGNDEAAEAIRKEKGVKTRPNFDVLNEVISHNIGGILAGVEKEIFSCSKSPFMNILCAKTTPTVPIQATERKIFNIAKYIRQMCISGASCDSQMEWKVQNEIKNYGSLVVMRGKGCYEYINGDFGAILKNEVSSYSESYKMLRSTCQGQMKGFQYSWLGGPMGSALLNCGIFNDQITEICDDVVRKLSVGAYMHLYEKFGVGKEVLQQCVQQMRQVVYDYSG
ncbi:Delta tubulin [Spironucleus salmonicida]|uniref:Tubulin delta chain n=1 Tax=Spironucleus salmonicida TaxID=348837 RepID=V6M185_9EUKA|nr:Delta tubulin [Spironucleus salmonicida]|eukprot:EST46939.1 Delta tubulin [Spironucleus salmonicida]